MPDIELADVVDDSTLELTGSDVLQIKDGGVTGAKLAALPESHVIGRASGAGTGSPMALDPDDLSTLLDEAADPFVRSSAGGGGDSTHTAAYGSRPAAGNPGDLFLPADGMTVERDTGSAWVPWGPVFPLTAPVDGDFAWVNQGGASVDTTRGGIYLLAPAGAGVNLRIRKKSAPATPYTITAAFLAEGLMLNNPWFGLLFRQSSDGKIAGFGIQRNTSNTDNLYSVKYADATTFSALYTGVGYKTSCLYFFRIADDGTNRICSFSCDGQHWQTFHTIGRTDFLTADEVGFWVNAEQGTWPVGVTLLSWKQGT